MNETATFEAFWEEFLRDRHSVAAQAPHIAAAAVTMGLVAIGVIARRLWLVAAGPAAGYAISSAARLAAGRPMARPHWALRADIRLLLKTLDGSLAAEIARIVGVPARERVAPRAVNLDVN